MEKYKEEKINELLKEAAFTNMKMAKALELVIKYHMTSTEKEDMAKRIDACSNMSELEGTITLINKELERGYYDENTNEKWSIGFVDQISRYYEQGFDFNPLEMIAGSINPVIDHIRNMEQIISENGEIRDKGMIMKELSDKAMKKMFEVFDKYSNMK
jgi:hypothetical protein